MDAATLAKLVGKANCRVFGWEDAANEPQRNVLAVLIEGFDHKEQDEDHESAEVETKASHGMVPELLKDHLL